MEQGKARITLKDVLMILLFRGTMTESEEARYKSKCDDLNAHKINIGNIKEPVYKKRIHKVLRIWKNLATSHSHFYLYCM